MTYLLTYLPIKPVLEALLMILIIMMMMING